MPLIIANQCYYSVELCCGYLPLMLQMMPVTEMMMRVMIDIKVIVDWLRADNFTSMQLITVRKPVL